MTQLLERIDHINIVVKDLAAATRFFVSLGFRQNDQSRLHGEWISKTVGLDEVDATYVKLSLPGDSTSLELIHFKHPRNEPVPYAGKANTQGLRHLAFRVTDIEATVLFLKEQGITAGKCYPGIFAGTQKAGVFQRPGGYPA